MHRSSTYALEGSPVQVVTCVPLVDVRCHLKGGLFLSEALLPLCEMHVRPWGCRLFLGYCGLASVHGERGFSGNPQVND